MKDPFAFRRKFEPKIIELTKQADKFSREYIETNDYSALNKYRYYVNEIIKLKNYIKEQESKEDSG